MNLGHTLNINNNVAFNNLSLLFNGSTQYGVLDAAAGDIDTDNGTYSIWIKFNGASSNNDNFIGASVGVGTNNQIKMFYLTATEVFRFLYKAGGTGKYVDISTDAETTQNWTHLAMTWDTDADELKAYVNGSQVGSTVGSLGTWSGTIDTITVGKNPIADNTYFIGYIDEISIFDEVVNISNLYNSGNIINLTGMTGLVGYYKLDIEGRDVLDYSGKGNTGSLVNTPTYSTETP